MGQLVDGLRVIEEGLQPGDWVIVNGIQRARPGAKVDPERTDMRSLTASALKAAAEKREGAEPRPAQPEGEK
jgi:multidrug efflux system membrane fusion protein